MQLGYVPRVVQFTAVIHGLLDCTRPGDIDHIVGYLQLGGKLIPAFLILDMPKDEVTYNQFSFPHLVVMVASKALLISAARIRA